MTSFVLLCLSKVHPMSSNSHDIEYTEGVKLGKNNNIEAQRKRWREDKMTKPQFPLLLPCFLTNMVHI